MKKSLFIILVLMVLLSVAITPAFAGIGDFGDTDQLDLIVLTDGDTRSVVRAVRNAGGTVNFEYENVPAVAFTIPSDSIGAVLYLPGVLRVEKDETLKLADLEKEKPMEYRLRGAGSYERIKLDAATFDFSTVPQGYANFMYTGAVDIWPETGAGAGSIVAVVDTGTARNFCLSHAVIGAPGFPDGYNASGDGYPATWEGNHYHGTFVAGTIASDCALDLGSTTDPLYMAQEPYFGWPVDFFPIIGQAPASEIYPVKVGDFTGVLQTSWIFDGLDHIVSLKSSGALDIDIVNMSLGGGTLFDGGDIFDEFVEKIYEHDMLLVTSASNDGPVPNSIGSPATSYKTVSVGALDYPDSSRVLYEFIGLTSMGGVTGQGMVMRPTDDVFVADFSSRGPLSDGRLGPEIQALGTWNFHQTADGGFSWASGTSFSAPTVAGGAALINAWWEARFGVDMPPELLEFVLLIGADPRVVGREWRSLNDQGHGALDLVATLDLLAPLGIQAEGDHLEELMASARMFYGEDDVSTSWIWLRTKVGRLQSNILGTPRRGQTQVWESDEVTLKQAETLDLVFDVTRFTSRVYVEIYDIETPDNSAYAWWPNSLTIHIQDAKRSGIEHPVNVYWYPMSYGDAVDIEIEDGPWTFWGMDWDYIPMEPGKMKVTLMPDVSNEDPVSFKVRVTRENYKRLTGQKIAKQKIMDGDTYVYAVDVPEGTSMATFDLIWWRDWSKFPTSDLDMLVYGPDFSLVSLDGATLNAPERAVLYEPEAGTYYLMVQGFEQNGFKDKFSLWMTIE